MPFDGSSLSRRPGLPQPTTSSWLAMPHSNSLTRALRQLIDSSEPLVAEAFRSSINELCDNVSLTRLAVAIAEHDIEGAIEELQIEPAAFNPLRKALIDAYEGGGELGAAAMQRMLRDGS